MIVRGFGCILLASLLPGLCVARAQKPLPTVSPSSQGILLDVAVDTKSGQPVTNLHQQDFVILDNKSPRPITSFKVMTAAQEPVEVILLLDTVNMPYRTVAYVRNTVTTFLRAGDAQLAYPTSIAVLTDNGMMVGNGFSTDGNALGDALAHQTIGLRALNRSSQWAGPQLLEVSLHGLRQLAGYTTRFPGRKLILWISPGWPLISGPGVSLDANQERYIFDQAVALSTQLREENVTLYNINPIGAVESMLRADYYKVFLDGAVDPGHAQLADLSLQVLAAQSGGLVFESNNDILGMIRKCLLDAQSWYAIGFDPLPDGKPNGFHRIDVKLDQRGLIVRARHGYYSNPTILEYHH